jgi:uncharacterized membrane protein YGL010W
METTPKTRLERYFADYAGYHMTPGNKACHYVGIPLIAITLLGLLGGLPIAGGLTGSEYLRLDGGTVFWVAASLWYLTLDWRLAVPFSLVTLGMYFVGRAMPVPMLWGLFVLGWVFQGIGHAVYEKKSPAFLKNIEHILIGPLWVFARISGYIH